MPAAAWAFHGLLGTRADPVPKLHRIDRKSRESELRSETPRIRVIRLNGAAFGPSETPRNDPLAMQKVVGSNPIIRFLESSTFSSNNRK